MDAPENVGFTCSLDWPQKWKHSAKDTECTGSEFETVLVSLESCLENYFRHNGISDRAAYARGDFFRERTQVVDIRDPNVISEEFVQLLQSWLRSNSLSNWRIVIPTVTTAGPILIYPAQLCVKGYPVQRFSEHVANLRELMLARKPVRQ